MARSPLSRVSLDRRRLVQGAAGVAGAAALAGKGISRAGAQDKPFDGTTIRWMSNQRHDVAVKQALFEQFKETSGIEVQMDIFADDYPNQLKIAFESGNPPDIFNMSSPRQEVAAGWPEPVDSYLANTPGLEESFLPGAFVPNRGIWGGQKYGLPMYAQTMRLYYNKTIFERAGLDPAAPPTTHTAFREAAKAITDELSGEQIYGLILGDKFTWVWWMNATIPAQGMGSYAYNWKTGKFEFNTDGFKNALQLMIDLKADGSIFPGIHTLTDDDARQQFSLGRAGMIIGGSWNPGVFNDQFESTEDWDTAELPQPDGGMLGRFQQGIGDRYTLSAAGEKKDAAWEVMKFMYSAETMTTMFAEGMGVMAVQAANTGESSVRGVPMLAPTERDVIIPPEPELPTMTPDYQTVFQEIWDNDGADMDAKLADLDARYNEALATAASDGTLVAEDFIIPDFDPLTWMPS